ncbi:MAG: RodZ domain-containing protein [Candidatus Zixiibacteriota bacterium]
MEYDYKEIGKVLKKRREELQRPLDEIAENIKISESYLAAIEEGQIDQLPSKVFYNLFVRSYAKELDVDSEQLLEDSAKPENGLAGGNGINGAPQDEKEKKGGGKKVFFIILAILIVAVVAIVIFSGWLDKKPVSNAGSTVDSLAGMGIDSLSDSLAVDSTEIEIILPDPLNMRMIATDLCWVLIVSDTDTVYNANMESNAIKNFQAYYEFRVSLGNPAGVQVALDGILLRPLSESGGPVRDVLINRDNMKDYFLFSREDEGESDQADSSSL